MGRALLSLYLFHTHPRTHTHAHTHTYTWYTHPPSDSLSLSRLTQMQHGIEVMKKLDHRNIIRLYEVIDDPHSDRLYLVLEYAEKVRPPYATRTRPC